MRKIFLALLFLPLLGLAQEQIEHQLLVQLNSGYTIENWLKRVQSDCPIPIQLNLAQKTSDPMRIYLIQWNEISWSDDEVRDWVRHQPEVSMVQFNHWMTERQIPNDTFFGSQWHHVDLEDNDIDADLAWDITTGGSTATGDEIVACVVETSGAKWDQEDLIDNHWVNALEIPDNGLDDDANGYIDDYDGWNITGANDNSSNGNHGTQVSSMIGAKGNNALGVSGVNWNVKIMQVQMGSISEANAIAAYTYPLVMRKLYNNTNGTQGAFVVVTNSSWGIDNGQASDAPLWCQMYDSLGYYGILSCAATANNNVNIDQVGDLPTTCPSNYLISVTATNSSDVRTFSGYGATQIDLGAPGEAVMMAGNTAYGTSSGTSFASPCVAGAVALLYSAPCNSFAQVANDNPALAAEWVRNYLFQGVDVVTNLQSEVATGGRLNVKNSLDLLLSNCVTGDCPAPFNVQTAAISNSVNQLLTWNTLDVSWAQVQYRVVGTVDWSILDSITGNQVELSDLQYCGEYECQVRLYCDTVMSDWSNTLFFTTDGCCQHPSYFQTSLVTADAISIQWNPVLAAPHYTVELYSSATGTQNFVVDVNVIELDSLQPCTNYIATVFSNCVGAGDQLITVPFQTLGCSSCADVPYCSVSTSSASTEWIAGVSLNDLNQSSGSDGGYGDYTGVSTTLSAGQNYILTITPGFSGLAYYEYFRGWMDWNANGAWEDNELVFDSGTAANAAVSGNITVPTTVNEGSVRLRVGMTYYGLSGTGEIPAACGTFNYGEFEDYCVTLSNSSEIVSSDISAGDEVFPNPFQKIVYFKPQGNQGYYQVTDVSGRPCARGKWTSEGLESVELAGLSSGLYTFQWWDQKGFHFSKIVKN